MVEGDGVSEVSTFIPAFSPRPIRREMRLLADRRQVAGYRSNVCAVIDNAGLGRSTTQRDALAVGPERPSFDAEPCNP